MILRALVSVLTVCVLNCLGAVSEASVITFSDRSTFQAALGSPLSEAMTCAELYDHRQA